MSGATAPDGVTLLPADVTEEDGVQGTARLGREALAYARLAHPAIVRLYDFVEDDGRLTLVMEHVDGLSLARVIAGLRACGEDLDEPSIWYVGYRIFLALAAAHAARDPMTREFAPVIHRDASPGNVLIPWDGYVKLTDFGVARLAGVAGDTRPGVVKGTIGYLAPEQVRGEPATVRTDVYTACLVMRELLLREPVFPREGKSELALLTAMASPSLIPLGALRPGLPMHVTDAVDRGLAPDPEARGVTAEEMASLLRSVINVDSARDRLSEKIARLRRREDASARSVAYATLPEGSASLFEEAPTQMETATEVTPAYAQRRESQQAVTSRPPPLPPPLVPPRPSPRTSMVMPRAQVLVPQAPTRVPQPSSIVRNYPSAPTPATAPMRPMVPSVPLHAPTDPTRPSAFLAISPISPPPTQRMIEAPRAQARPAFASRTSSALIVETPNAMTTALLPDLSEREQPDLERAPRRRSLFIAAAAAAIAMGVTIGVVLGWRERTTAAAATAAAATAAARAKPRATVPRAGTAPVATAPAPAIAPTPTAAVAVAPAPAPARAVTPGTGRLLTATSERGHRVFVDGRVAGSGGAPLVVRCGSHDVRVGSAGRLRKVEIPCGGELEVSR